MPDINDGKCLQCSAVLGAVYGAAATMTSTTAAVTPFGIALTMIIGAALFACVASALCRCYHVWRAIAASANDVCRDP